MSSERQCGQGAEGKSCNLIGSFRRGERAKRGGSDRYCFRFAPLRTATPVVLRILDPRGQKRIDEDQEFLRQTSRDFTTERSFLTECYISANRPGFFALQKRTFPHLRSPKNTSVIVGCWSRSHVAVVSRGFRGGLSDRLAEYRSGGTGTNIQRVRFTHCSALSRKNIICRGWKGNSFRL